MTKITQDTELKAGMKVMIDENKYTIIETVMRNYSLVKDCKAIVNRTKDGILLLLVQRNAKIIEDNEKVIVSELISKKLEKAKRESIELDCGNFTVHSFAWKFLGKLSNDDISKEELSFQKIVKICEGTTFDKNGWEVEKPKRWRADKCETD